MGTWYRTPNFYNIVTGTASQGSEITLSGAPYFYSADHQIRVKENFSVPKVNGSYTATSTWQRPPGTGQGGTPSFAQTKVDVTVTGSDVRYQVYGRVGPVALKDNPTNPPWKLDADVTEDVSVNPVWELLHDFQPNLQGADIAENSFVGNDEIEFTKSWTGSPVTTLLECRAFALQGAYIENSTINPNQENPPSALSRGFVYALAAADSWVPSGAITTRLEISQSSTTIDTASGSIPVPGSSWTKDSNGRLSAFSLLSWDGKVDDEYLTGTYTAKMRALVSLPEGGEALSEETRTITVQAVIAPVNYHLERRLRRQTCGEPFPTVNRDGQVNESEGLDAMSGGPSNLSLGLANRAANSSNMPASFGYGWSLNRDETLTIDTEEEKLIHRFNGGQLEVWNIVNGVYEPEFENNFATLTEDPNNGTFLMTYRSKVQKQFHAMNSANPGKIEWEKDRNGNTTYFHYSGDKLEAISDSVYNGNPDGRISRFEYPTGELQPNKIVSERKESGVLKASRETTFECYSTTDSSEGFLMDRLKSITNPAGESRSFLYYADNSDFRYGKVYRLLDARGHIVKEYDYFDDSLVRVKSVTNYGTSGSTPEMKTEFLYGSDLVQGTVTVIVTSTDLTGRSTVSTRTQINHYSNDEYRNLVRTEDAIDGSVIVFETKYEDHLTNTPGNPYLPTKSIDPNLEYSQRTYNAEGRVVQVQDKLGRVTTIQYLSSDPDLIEKVVKPAVTVPDPANPGQTKTEVYETNFTYDAKSNLVSVEHAIQGGPAQRKTTILRRNGVDHAETDGQIYKIIDRRWDGTGTGDDFATVFDYEDNGNLKSIQTPTGPGAHPGTKLTFEHDDFDNVTKVTDLLGNEWEAVYDDIGRIIEQETAREKKSYMTYVDGLMTEIALPPNEGPGGTQSRSVGTSGQGRVTTFIHDYAGRVVEVKSDNSATTTETRLKTERTGFSELHKLVRTIDQMNKSTEWKYDELGRAVEMVDSLSRTLALAYQPFCKQSDATSARGVKSSRSLDALCRPRVLETSDQGIEYRYDELGRLVEVSHRDGKSRYGTRATPPHIRSDYESARYSKTEDTWRYEYDHLDRMTKAIYPGGEEVEYEYGYVDELLKMTDTDGKVTKYEYNNDLSVQKVIIERNQIDVRDFTYTYDAGGRMAKVVYSDGLEVHFDDGGSPAESGFDADGQLTHMRYLKDDGQGGFELIRSFSYVYDDSGNRIEMLESNGTPIEDIKWLYRYDWFDRLVEVWRGVGGATPALQREYVYDESDNRIYLDDHVNARTLWYRYKVVGTSPDEKYSDEIVEVLEASGVGKRAPGDIGDFNSLETFVFDDDGNMTSRTTSAGTTNYGWDDFNNLRSVELENSTLTKHDYDPSLIRDEMTKDSGEKVKSFYSGMATVNETSSTGSSSNISYLKGHQLLGYEKNGSSFYFITDGLSSVRAVVDTNGTEVATFEHDEFGLELGASGSSPKTYVGGLGVHDDTSETRLLYMRRRHYDPSLGRFLNRDPIGFRGGLNLFNYPTNPVNLVDPEGLHPVHRFVERRLKDVFTQLKDREYTQDCRDAVAALAEFCTLGGFEKDNPELDVLDNILAEALKTPKGWNGGPAEPFSQTRPGTSLVEGHINLGGDFAMSLPELGQPGKELTERQLEVAFHEVLHFTGVGHSSRDHRETHGHIPGEAFMIHVTRVCVGTSGKHAAYPNHKNAYLGSQLYWSGDYRGYPGLESLIWKFSVK